MTCYCNKKPILVVLWCGLKTTLAEGSMVVQTTRYVNFSKFFEWVLVNLSMLFQIVATIVYGFPFFIFQIIICVSGEAKV